MPRSSYTQSGFLGGEWSPLAGGRYDHPFYRQALQICRNAIVVEEGAWTRRSGLEMLGPSYLRLPSKFHRFQSNAAFPFIMEFTSSKLRFWYSTGPVCTNDRQIIVTSSSGGGSITMTTTTDSGWIVGDHILLFTPTTLAASDIAVVRGRHLQITAVAGTRIDVGDDLGNPLPTDISANGLNGATAMRILRFVTGIADADIPKVRIVQAQTQALVLAPTLLPAVATVTTEIVAGSDTDPTIAYGNATFKDGPYLDPEVDTGTVSGYTGSITFSPTSTTFDNTDIGRHIRLFSQPADWASGTTYTNGQYVTYPPGSSEWWVFSYSAGLAGVIPGTSYTTSAGITYTPWAPAPAAGVWAWGIISAEADTSCSVTLETDLNSANGSTISVWMRGVYKVGQYPTNGVYHEGRIWLAGAVRNRFDATMSNFRPPDIPNDGAFWFSPTDVNGNVLDNSGIGVTLNFDDLSDIFWMKPDHQGIIVGTNGGEILISASALNDPITPTSIQAHRVTVEQCANVEAVRAGISLILVQRYGKRILEHLADAFSGKFSAAPINEFALHISDPGVKELAYQHEKTPVVWALMNDGTLAGCTYRRKSRFVSEPPVMNAWHSHRIGDGAVTVNSMAVTPGVDGLSDSLYLNTLDANGDYWVELMRPIYEGA